MKLLILIVLWMPLTAFSAEFISNEWGYASAEDSNKSSPEEKWKSINSGNYVYIIKESCFSCRLSYRTKVYVVGDRVVKAVNTDTLLESAVEPRLRDYKTMNELFGLVKEAYKDSHDVFEVTYSPYLGYPTKLVLDPEYKARDDEYSFIIEEFSFIKKSVEN